MKCPKCNVTIRMTEDIYWEFVPNNTIEMAVAGKCPKCNHAYRWTQIYSLKEEKELEDDE